MSRRPTKAAMRRGDGVSADVERDPRRNAAAHAPPRRVVERLLVGVAVLSAVFLWSYWPVLATMVHAWSTVDDYSHGYFVAPVALYFLWARRGRLPALAEQISWGGAVLIAAATTVRLAGAWFYLGAFEAWSIPLWVGGVFWLLGGPRVFLWSLPAVAFLGFMIPLPYGAESIMSLPLQRVATVISCWSLQFLGMPALAEGNVIWLDGFELEVAQACSGLRMFVSIGALAFAYATLTRRPWLLKTLLLLSALPIAVLANSLRVTATGALYVLVSGEAARHFSHDVAGWLMIPVAAAIMGLLLWFLGRVIVEVESVDAVDLLHPKSKPRVSENLAVQ